ncbi:MAG: prepilin peptidase [Candidatus Dadabacteria bacterium]|nr:MAG: prepilin peptidase [Candidatus Dadabacteria bacterium]
MIAVEALFSAEFAPWRGMLGLVFGLLVGSFTNVLIARIPFGDSIVHPPSRCPNCFSPIPWYANIPILSWLMLGRRCRNCKIRIPIRYPLVELLVGVLWAWIAAWSTDPWTMAGMLYFATVLVALSFIDLDWYILPDVLTLQLAAVGILWRIIGGEQDWARLAVDVLLGPGLLMTVRVVYSRLRGREGLGLGDVKLMAGVGAFTGVEGVVASLVLGSMAGTVVGIGLMLFRRGSMSTALPFGPFLAAGALVAALASLHGLSPALWLAGT